MSTTENRDDLKLVGRHYGFKGFIFICTGAKSFQYLLNTQPNLCKVLRYKVLPSPQCIVAQQALTQNTAKIQEHSNFSNQQTWGFEELQVCLSVPKGGGDVKHTQITTTTLKNSA